MLGIKSRLLRKENIFTTKDFKQGNGNHRKGVKTSTDKPNFMFETIATLGSFDGNSFHEVCYGEYIGEDYGDFN